MELNELKSTWQILEKALERGNQLSMAMLRQQKLDAAHRSLRPLKLNQAFQVFVGVLFIILAALLWSTKPTAISVILGGIVIQAYGIGCVITAGMVFSSLSRIDYAAAVVEVQSVLANVRRAYGICVLVAGLSWWFLWMPLLMLLAVSHTSTYMLTLLLLSGLVWQLELLAPWACTGCISIPGNHPICSCVSS